jgi:hypothetical protein
MIYENSHLSPRQAQSLEDAIEKFGLRPGNVPGVNEILDSGGTASDWWDTDRGGFLVEADLFAARATSDNERVAWQQRAAAERVCAPTDAIKAQVDPRTPLVVVREVGLEILGPLVMAATCALFSSPVWVAVASLPLCWASMYLGYWLVWRSVLKGPHTVHYNWSPVPACCRDTA